VLSLSSNSITADSGIYYEDYFYNASCHSQGENYLDAYNGHEHGNLGYHYHLTIDKDSLYPTFPYIVGPKYYGCIPGDSCPTTILSTTSTTMSTCGASTATSSACAANNDNGSNGDDNNGDKSSGLGTPAVIGIAVGGGAAAVGGIAAVVFSMSKASGAAAVGVH
jgi:hypothetical protein